MLLKMMYLLNGCSERMVKASLYVMPQPCPTYGEFQSNLQCIGYCNLISKWNEKCKQARDV
jgi:hypothetical protein